MTIYNGTSGDDIFTIDFSELADAQFLGGAGTDTVYITGLDGNTHENVGISIGASTFQNIEVLYTQSALFTIREGEAVDLSDLVVYRSPEHTQPYLALNIEYEDSGVPGGSSTLTGTRSVDFIKAGNNGNYTIYGSDRSDIIEAGSGGEFYLTADNPNTTYNAFYGGWGGDVIYGGAGMNYLYGGEEHDDIHGADGAMNHIYGGAQGGNFLFGGNGLTVDVNGVLLHDTFFMENNFGIFNGEREDSYIRNFDLGGDIINFALNDSVNNISDITFTNVSPHSLDIEVEGHGVLNIFGIDTQEFIANTHLWFSNDINEVITPDSVTPNSFEVLGSTHADILFGQASNDTVSAGEGNDRLYGYAGDDTLDGGEGNDRIRAGTGNDDIVGGNGKDNLAGGAGSDNISGGAGTDTIYGNDGDDYLAGGSGRDFLYGGDGADTFVFDNLDASDRVKDFDLAEGDSLDISSILSGFDPNVDDINDFVSLHIKSATKAVLKVNDDGIGNDSQYAGIVYGDLTGQTIDTLVANNDLIVV